MHAPSAGLAAALASMRQGQPARAAEECRRLLESTPNDFGARHLLGVALMAAGEHEAAEREIARAIAIDPAVPGAHYNRGNALQALGRFDDAVASYDEALRRKPDFAEALRNRGDAFARGGQAAQAIDSYHAALALHPEWSDTWNNLGSLLFAAQRHEDALVAYRSAIAAAPHVATAWDNAGLALQQLGRHEEAIQAHGQALLRAPTFAPAYVRRAMALRHFNRFDEALRDTTRALELDAGSALAHNAHGIVLNDLGRYDEAIAAYEAALSLAPEFAEAHNNLGNALHDAGRFEDALSALDRAIAARPHYAEALGNRGLALHELQRFDDALVAFDEAIAARPNYAEAWKRRASLRLLQGDYVQGWADYDESLARMRRDAAETPWWKGESLQGKSILLEEPNGFGDALQFWRYVPVLQAMGADVAFHGRASLFRLLRSSPWSVRMLADVPADARFDYRSHLWSVPRLLRTTLDTIPGGVPYIEAEPGRVARWASLLPANTFNIGIAWQGNPARKVDAGRSVPLRAFAPLASMPGVQLVSLQRTHGLEQLRDLPDGMSVIEPGDEFDAGADAFVDTAALMQSLDLVIASDSAVAHLAGAMGRPTWIALKHVPEWRWLLEREDTPWYPTMRLFRQPARGDWDGVFASMRDALGDRQRRIKA